MPSDPFKKFQHIPSVDDILETAFNRANKRAGGISDKKGEIHRARRKEVLRIEIAYDYVMEYLQSIVKSVPDLTQLPPFYVELAQILVDNDLLKQKLGRISGVIKVLERLKHQHIKTILTLQKEFDIGEKRKQAFGRMKSVIDKLSSDFDYLRKSRQTLKGLPVINQYIPAVVIAGYPNVGKSSCVNNLCGSKIEVAPYPFTTKEIIIWFYKHDREQIQFIDTPGVLDRPMAKRNRIELQALTAMKHLANLIVFLVDPTLNCGYPLDVQLDLLKEIQVTFLAIPRLIVITKKDLATDEEFDQATKQVQALGEQTIFAYSAITRENEAPLMASIKEYLKNFRPPAT